LRQSGIAYSYHSGLSDAEVLEKYFEADIVTLVSTYEGFGMPILEGQATGRPVITSNLYSMPEVAGDAACIVDPFDARAMRAGFRRLIEDDEYRQALVAKGFDNVKRFDPDRIAEQYLALYQDIAANH
jgi:glycosyltransferase involved in cell wall biosynthesis